MTQVRVVGRGVLGNWDNARALGRTQVSWCGVPFFRVCFMPVSCVHSMQKCHRGTHNVLVTDLATTGTRLAGKLHGTQGYTVTLPLIPGAEC
jgi:hypothetical protein